MLEFRKKGVMTVSKTIVIDKDVHKALRAVSGMYGFTIGDYASAAILNALITDYGSTTVKQLISDSGDLQPEAVERFGHLLKLMEIQRD